MVVGEKEQNTLSDRHFGQGLDVKSDALSYVTHARQIVLSPFSGELDSHTGFEPKNEQQVDDERIRPVYRSHE